MIRLKFVKDDLTAFLQPLRKISNLVTINCTGNKIWALLSSDDDTMIGYTEKICSEGTELVDCKINICDINKLLHLISLTIGKFIDLQVIDNYLQYSSGSVQFKLYMFDDLHIKTPTVSVEKIVNFSYDTYFSVDKQKFAEASKMAVYSSDVDKVYISTEDKAGVYFNFTDKARHNTDSIKILVSDKVGGTYMDKAAPINISNLLKLANSNNCTIKIKHSPCIVMFDNSADDHKLLYIITSLIQ